MRPFYSPPKRCVPIPWPPRLSLRTQQVLRRCTRSCSSRTTRTARSSCKCCQHIMYKLIIHIHWVIYWAYAKVPLLSIQALVVFKLEHLPLFYSTAQVCSAQYVSNIHLTVRFTLARVALRSTSRVLKTARFSSSHTNCASTRAAIASSMCVWTRTRSLKIVRIWVLHRMHTSTIPWRRIFR